MFKCVDIRMELEGNKEKFDSVITYYMALIVDAQIDPNDPKIKEPSMLANLIEDLKDVRDSGKFIPTRIQADIPSCSVQALFLKIHKVLRYFFIACYYYITPFLILVFQIMLLYAGAIYTKLKSSYFSDLVDDATILDPSLPDVPPTLLL